MWKPRRMNLSILLTSDMCWSWGGLLYLSILLTSGLFSKMRRIISPSSWPLAGFRRWGELSLHPLDLWLVAEAKKNEFNHPFNLWFVYESEKNEPHYSLDFCHLLKLKRMNLSNVHPLNLGHVVGTSLSRFLLTSGLVLRPRRTMERLLLSTTSWRPLRPTRRRRNIWATSLIG